MRARRIYGGSQRADDLRLLDHRRRGKQYASPLVVAVVLVAGAALVGPVFVFRQQPFEVKIEWLPDGFRQRPGMALLPVASAPHQIKIDCGLIEIARIVSLIRRYTRFNQQDGISQQLEFDGLKIDIENRSVTTENGTFELPPKEFDLLLYCAKNQGKILTKQQIYEEVWREEYFYDDSNIMAIISRLRKKLEVNPGSPKYIQTIKGIGYRFNKEV